MNKKEQQQHIDVAKWFLSEQRRYDMCGNYDYCHFCIIHEENPCSNAVCRMKEAQNQKVKTSENTIQTNQANYTFENDGACSTQLSTTQTPNTDVCTYAHLSQNCDIALNEEVASDNDSPAIEKASKPTTTITTKNVYPANVVVRSFEEKLSDADDHTIGCYKQIKNELLSYKNVTNRVSQKCDNYRAGRGNLIAKLTYVGKSLYINFPLDPNDEKYSGRKFPHKDVSAIKAYADAPFQFKITSDLAMKRCMVLIGDVAVLKQLEKRKVKTQ